MLAAQAPYTPPRLISRASNVVSTASAGRVLVQVEVNADGSFKVLRVVRSTNPDDNDAALDVARHSRYQPATRNGKPVRGLFDYDVVFNESSLSGAGGQIATLLHENDFAAAKAAALSALAKNPNDPLVQAQLGVAEAFLHDIPSAIAAFDKAGSIPDMYQNVAMQAYSLNAVTITATQPQLAQREAQKAVLLHGDYGAYYALGVAQHANKDDMAAVASLQEALQLAQTASPPADERTVANIDEELLAIAQTSGDNSMVQKITAEVQKMDPSYAGRLLAYTIDMQAADAEKRHDPNAAVTLYEKAAQADPNWAGGPEYTKAAIAEATEPIPNLQAARLEAEKAITQDPNYAPAYYIDAIVMGKDALGNGNMDEMQRATDYAYKAATLAQQQGNARLAASAQYFAKYHQMDSNLQFWSTQTERKSCRAASRVQRAVLLNARALLHGYRHRCRTDSVHDDDRLTGAGFDAGRNVEFCGNGTI